MTKIIIRNHGPVRIEGPAGEFIVCDAEGNVFDLAGRTAISLCRCGRSGDKPFCDGHHKECAFQSEVKARALLPPVVPLAPPAAAGSTGTPKA